MNRRAKQIEKLLNRIRLSDRVGLGELVGGYLDQSWSNKPSYVHVVLWSLRQLFWPSRHRLQMQIWNYPYKRNQDQILICCASASSRHLDFFKWLEPLEDLVCWIVLGGPSLIPSKSLASNLPIGKKLVPLSLCRKIWQMLELSWLEKLQILSISSLQYRRYVVARQFIHDNYIRAVLTDFDRYPANVYWVLAARSLSIPTTSLVHGATNPIDHYLPVLADQLWVWGSYQQEQFRQYHGAELAIRIVGNPKVRSYQSKPLQNWHTAGLGMTKLPREQRLKLIDIFLHGTSSFSRRIIKIHPQEDIKDYQNYLDQGIEIICPKKNTKDFLESIDVLCTRRSQLGSDALPYDMPIIICDGINDGDLQNGKVLHEKAGCPIVNDAKSLKNELKLLQSDNVYLRHRLEKQKTYYSILYSYTGTDSVQEMNKALKNYR